MSSWFGGPSDRDRDRSRRHSSHPRSRSRDREHRKSSSGTTTIYRQPSSGHGGGGHRGSSPPKYAFVRSKSNPSPTRSSHSFSKDRSYSFTKDRSYSDRDRGYGGYGYPDGAKSFTSLFSTLSGGDRDRYATRGGGSSYYKRRPRDGFIARLVHTIRRYIRQLMDYARRHPVKVLLLVVMPLVTGGALSGVMRSMGLSVPAALDRFGGGGQRGRGVGGGGEGFGVEQAMSIAKMFI